MDLWSECGASLCASRAGHLHWLVSKLGTPTAVAGKDCPGPSGSVKFLRRKAEWRSGGDAVYLKVRGGVGEGAVLHVHDQTEMVQEICTKDRLFDISDNKNPSKCATQTQIESEGANMHHKSRSRIH